MSNTTEITPYESQPVISGTTSSSGGVCAAACDALRWLCETTDDDSAALAEAKDLQRHERVSAFLAQGRPPRITTARLRLKCLDPFLQSAQSLGYTLRFMNGSPSSSLLLQKANGEKLAISRERGRLAVSTVGGMEQIHALMRQHTQDRVVAHLSKRLGMQIRSAKLANGEIQISARETCLRHGDGQAVMKAQIRQDGGLWVDVDGIKGNRCEKIAATLAEVMGGEIKNMNKKGSTLTLPGEPARNRVRL